MNLDRSLILTELPTGATARVVSVDGGRDVRMRCLALGLRVGAEVTVSHSRGHGRGRGLVIACDGSRVALGPEMARHLVVEETG